MFVFVWQDLIVMFRVMTRGEASPTRHKRPFLLLVLLFGLIVAYMYFILRNIESAVAFVLHVVVIGIMTFEMEKVIKVTILWKMFPLLSCL